MCLKIDRYEWFDIVQDFSHMTGVTLLVGVMPAAYSCLFSGKPMDRFLINLYMLSLFWHFVSLCTVIVWRFLNGKNRNGRRRV